MPQSLAKVWVHLIFSTKNRYPFLLDEPIRKDMHAYLATVLRNHDCETLIVGGVEDHVHALFALSRNFSIADIVKEIKITSSRSIKEKIAHAKEVQLAERVWRVFCESITFGSGYALHRASGRASQARDVSG